ncbi:MAG: putative porin [Ignavibacterium sp.]
MKLLFAVLLFSFNSFSQIKDSLLIQQIISDTSMNIDSTVIQRDSTVILNLSYTDNHSIFISRKDIVKSNYRFAGDLLNDFPFAFQRDYGFIGYPNEVMMFGVGNSFINWMTDGISQSERLSNSFYLNLIQTEDIDSIEIVPLTRGFLYGSYMNPLTVNFITRDFIPPRPYSRIRYIQGPDREASVDVNFHALLSKNFLFSFDISNRIKDSTFRNTEFSLWQVKTKVKYFLSNHVNILATYNYDDYKLGFNGGIDVDSITKITSDVNSILYDNFLAPVKYPNGELKTLQHFPKLSLLTNFFSWLKSDLNFYYRYSRYDERADFQKNIEEDVYGFSFPNKITVKNFEFNLLFDYENIKQTTEIIDDRIVPSGDLIYNNERKIFSVGGILTARLLQDKLNVSLFYKHSGFQEKYYSNVITNNLVVNDIAYTSDFNNSGMGADVSFKFNDNLKFYAGSSFLNKYSIDDSKESLLFQAGLSYNNEFLSANALYFINEYDYRPNYSPLFMQSISSGDVDGLGLSIKAKYKFVLLESQNAKYNSRTNNSLNGLPEWNSRTGLYFNDYLFNDNLDLKAGFVLTYIGKQNYLLFNNNIEVPAVTRIDFTVAGEIRKAAIVYFVLENILDKKYYLTPYYPMPERNFRFGIAWEFLD